MFDDGIHNDYEEAHQKGFHRGFDLGWSYKGRHDRSIIEDMIKTLDKQCEKCARSGGKLKILAQKDILRQILKEMKITSISYLT